MIFDFNHEFGLSRMKKVGKTDKFLVKKSMTVNAGWIVISIGLLVIKKIWD